MASRRPSSPPAIRSTTSSARTSSRRPASRELAVLGGDGRPDRHDGVAGDPIGCHGTAGQTAHDRRQRRPEVAPPQDLARLLGATPQVQLEVAGDLERRAAHGLAHGRGHQDRRVSPAPVHRRPGHAAPGDHGAMVVPSIPRSERSSRVARRIVSSSPARRGLPAGRAGASRSPCVGCLGAMQCPSGNPRSIFSGGPSKGHGIAPPPKA